MVTTLSVYVSNVEVSVTFRTNSSACQLLDQNFFFVEKVDDQVDCCKLLEQLSLTNGSWNSVQYQTWGIIRASHKGRPIHLEVFDNINYKLVINKFPTSQNFSDLLGKVVVLVLVLTYFSEVVAHGKGFKLEILCDHFSESSFANSGSSEKKHVEWLRT